MNTDKSILITGCSTGIGFGVAKNLSALGYKVFATCRNHNDVKKLNGLRIENLKSVQLDVTDTKSIDSALEHILKKTGGKIDVLFNNAGFGQPGAVEDLSKNAIIEQFDTNVFGLLELTNKIIPIMRQQGNGKIIVNSSILGFISLRYRGAYIASKYALEGLFDTLRLELASSPISISIIQPGPITSNFRFNAYKAFLKHINPEVSYHSNQYKIMEKRFKPINSDNTYKPTLFELNPDDVTKKIIKILNSKRPRARYSITVPTYTFRLLTRLLPTKILDRILLKVTKNEAE